METRKSDFRIRTRKYLIVIGLTGVAICILGSIGMLLWKSIIPNIFLDRSLVPAQINFFQSMKIIVFLFIVALSTYSFHYFRLIVRRMNTSEIGKDIMFLLILCIVSLILGSIVYLFWGWLALDIFNIAVSKNIISEQISMGVSIVISLLCLTIVASDDVLNIIITFMGMKHFRMK